MQIANRKIVYHRTRKLLVESCQEAVSQFCMRAKFHSGSAPLRFFALYLCTARELLAGWMFLLARRIFIDFYSAPVWLAGAQQKQ
jgi:hypothetical protein